MCKCYKYCHRNYPCSICFYKKIQLNCLEYVSKLTNLIKQKLITVPFSSFGVVNGGQILGRCFVEAADYKTNIDGTVISLMTLECPGYNENISLLDEKNNSLVCSCFVNPDLFNSSFYMKVLITYI